MSRVRSWHAAFVAALWCEPSRVKTQNALLHLKLSATSARYSPLCSRWARLLPNNRAIVCVIPAILFAPFQRPRGCRVSRRDLMHEALPTMPLTVRSAPPAVRAGILSLSATNRAHPRRAALPSETYLMPTRVCCLSALSPPSHAPQRAYPHAISVILFTCSCSSGPARPTVSRPRGIRLLASPARPTAAATVPASNGPIPAGMPETYRKLVAYGCGESFREVARVSGGLGAGNRCGGQQRK